MTTAPTFFARLLHLVVIAAALLLPGTAAAADPAKPITILGITLFEDLFFNDVVAGMKFQAKKEGVNLVLANSNHDLATETRLIESYTKLGLGAIVLSPADANKSALALQKAHHQGIKIVAYNDALNADFVSTTVSSSQNQLGTSTGEAARRYISTQLGGKARIAVLCFDSLLPAQSDARVRGFLDAATKGLPDVKLVARQDAWEAGPAIKKADDLLKAHPDIDIIFAANEGGTIGAQLAIKNAGKGKQIKVFGTDAAKQEIDMLLADDGILQAVTGQHPYDMGARAIAAAVRAVKGQPVDKTVVIPGILLARDKPQDIRSFRAQTDAR